jgi:hypothetical protein
LAAQRARRDAIVPCEVFKCTKLTLAGPHTLLQDLNAGLGSNAYIAFIEIYAARRFP